MECPKCGRAVAPGAFFCPACEYILDTSFLGEDITDDERDQRSKSTSSLRSPKAVKTLEKPVDFGEDAIILGNGQGDYSDFSSKDAGMTREVTHARFYIGGNTAAILHVDSVPEISPGLLNGSIKMSPFERHVLGFINGKRSIGRIQKKSAMEDSEFKTSVAMLADKGIIRLRTTKKRKKTDNGPSSLPSRSEVSRVAPAPSSPVADRTVVASFEQISADHARQSAQSAARAEQVPARAPAKSNRTSAPEATVIKSAEAKNKSVGTAGFASMRIQEARAEPAATDDWGEGDNQNNISNVFARATPTPVHKVRVPSRAGAPAIVDAPARPPPIPPDATGDFVPVPAPDELIAPGGADDFRARSNERPVVAAEFATAVPRAEAGHTTALQARPRTSGETVEPPYSIDQNDVESVGEDGVPAAFRDPTGLGDVRAVEMRGGEPVDPDERDGADVAAPADDVDGDVDGDVDAAADGNDEDSRTAGIAARPYTDDVPTGPLPHGSDDDADQDEIDVADDDQSFDADLRTAHLDLNSANTASLPAKEPVAEAAPPEVMELPQDALSPLPSRKYPAPAAPPIPQLAQALPAVGRPPPGLPGQVTAAPSLPGQAAPSRPVAPAAPGLPGAMGARPPTQALTKGGLPVPARPSAGSTVPYEQGRKAEKIFEQALKDHAEGRISSARMNAKLAAMYDPSVETYRAFLADLDAMGANAKAPGGGKPKELTLFEQASDAEGRGDFEMAVHLLEEAVSINPKAAALRNRLGVVMSIRLKHHNEALEQLRIAIELEPGNIVYMNNFSKVTALLDSQLERGPDDKNGRKGRKPEKIDIKKMRPKMF